MLRKKFVAEILTAYRMGYKAAIYYEDKDNPYSTDHSDSHSHTDKDFSDEDLSDLVRVYDAGFRRGLRDVAP